MCQGANNSTVRNNLIFNNSGRGISIRDYVEAVYPDTDPPTDMENNAIVNNIFWVGLYVPLCHPTSAGNSWTGYNGAIRLADDTKQGYSIGHQEIRNNIFITYGSSNDPKVGASIETSSLDFIKSSDIKNNIFFSQAGGTAVLHDEVTDMAYSLTDFAQLADNGNIYADPLLKDYSIDYWNHPGKFDFNLTSASPAINFGVSDEKVFKDLRGNLRDGKPDAGCYEYGEVLQGDINIDGEINIQDLQLCVNVILGIETEAEIVSRANVNGDEQVNVSDVQVIVNVILNSG